jgi:hypothetical protein
VQTNPFTRATTRRSFEELVFSAPADGSFDSPNFRKGKPSRWGPLSHSARGQAGEIRNEGACIRCKELKKKVSDDSTISELIKLAVR